MAQETSKLLFVCPAAHRCHGFPDCNHRHPHLKRAGCGGAKCNASRGDPSLQDVTCGLAFLKSYNGKFPVTRVLESLPSDHGYALEVQIGDSAFLLGPFTRIVTDELLSMLTGGMSDILDGVQPQQKVRRIKAKPKDKP